MSISEETALRFEKLCTEHVDRLMAIELEAYPDPWTHGMMRQEMRNPSSNFFVAFSGETLVGYAGFWLMFDEAHITKVTVAGPFRGRGYGRTLVEFLLRRATALGATTARLEVRESNEIAYRLYDTLSFRVIGERKGYYSRTNETALVMVKDLAPE